MFPVKLLPPKIQCYLVSDVLFVNTVISSFGKIWCWRVQAMMVKYHFGGEMGHDCGRYHAKMMVAEPLRYILFFGVENSETF